MGGPNMDSGTSDLSGLFDRVSPSDEIALRVASIAGRVSHFVADCVPAAGTNVDGRLHDYGTVQFASFLVPGAFLVDWLRGNPKSILERFQLPDLNGTVAYRREPSRAMWNPASWPWPHTRYEISPQLDSRQSFHGFLIARDDSRSFKDYSTAGLHYLYGVDEPRSPNDLPSYLGVIRLVDTRGRITSVVLSATRAKFGVSGALGGRIELASPTISSAQAITEDRDYPFDLPDGLPDECLVLLTNSGDWIDYRWLGRRMGTPSDATIEPADFPAQVKAQILLGEGPQTEFKLKMPDKGPNRESLLKTAAAFASDSGGLILVGVSEKGQANEGEVVGLADAANVRDSLVDLIRRVVIPEPNYDVSVVTVDGKDLVVIGLQADGRPHGIHPDRIQFFVRRGASTFSAQYGEIEAAFVSAASRTGQRRRL